MKDVYDVFDGMSYELTSSPAELEKYSRASLSFTMTNNTIIDKRPLYCPSGNKVYNLIEYMQFLVCLSLNKDLKLKEKSFQVYGAEMPGFFYSPHFPFVGWKIYTEEADINITGCILTLKKESGE